MSLRTLFALVCSAAPLHAQCPLEQLSGPPTAFYELGGSVAIHGDTVFAATGSIVVNPGRVHVYERVGGAWTATGMLAASPLTKNHDFGCSMDIEGDRAVVGAPTPVNGDDAVFVFERSAGTWQQVQRIPNRGRFGTAVRLCGDELYVGDPRYLGTGRVHHYQRISGHWVEVATFEAAGLQNNDAFGTSFDVDGDTLVVGAPGVDVGSFLSAGAAFVFERVAGVWTEVARLDNPAPTPFQGGNFGFSVAIHADVVLVGAPTDDQSNGAVHFFERNGGAWTHVRKLVPSAQDQLGVAVALDEEAGYAGAPAYDFRSGGVFVYQETPSGWEQAEVIEQGAIFARFGTALDLAGNELVVGAPNTNVGNVSDGAAHVATLPCHVGAPFCGPAQPNSTGSGARIDASGSRVVASNDFTLTASALPPGQSGYFLASRTAAFFQPPGSAGNICIGGNVGRFDLASRVFQGPTATLRVDLASVPVNRPGPIGPGETWYFQAWFTDVPSTYNFTDAFAVQFL